MFTSDGRDDVDIRRRIGMAVSRCGQLRFILGASHIKKSTKMKIYKTAVGSLFTYGSEAWGLNEANLRSLNGANAGCLHRFTGKSRVEEVREASSTYSLCRDIRNRRLSWLGHILRMKDNPDGTRRLVKIVANVQFDMGGGGNLLMDAPKTQHFGDLEAYVADRKLWKRHRL